MKKEIKFRAWHKQHKEMKENPPLWGASRGGIDELNDSLRRIKEQYVLMAFIGITDKNGIEVYEGDYFQVAGNKIYEVRWVDKGESKHETYAATFVLWLNDELFFPFDEWALQNGEVIGNIYENLKPVSL